MKAIGHLNESELQGLVSIIIPAFNAGRYLAETLDSCLSQTYSNIEVIVVDDGSTDDTAGISAAYSIRDPRVISLHQSNSGQCSARNHALQTAKGEWVWFLDSDDLLFPWAVAELKALALRKNTQMAIGQERGPQRPRCEMRLSFGVQSVEGIEEGIRRLARAVKAVMGIG